MDAPTIRDKIIAGLDDLSSEELAWILEYVEAMKSNRLPEDYDPEGVAKRAAAMKRYREERKTLKLDE